MRSHDDVAGTIELNGKLVRGGLAAGKMNQPAAGRDCHMLQVDAEHLVGFRRLGPARRRKQPFAGRQQSVVPSQMDGLKSVHPDECSLSAGNGIVQFDGSQGRCPGIAAGNLGLGVGRSPNPEKGRILMIGRQLVRGIGNGKGALLQPDRLPAADFKHRPVVGRYIPGDNQLHGQIGNRQPARTKTEHAARILYRIGFVGPENQHRLVPLAGPDRRPQIGHVNRLFLARTVVAQFDHISVVGGCASGGKLVNSFSPAAKSLTTSKPLCLVEVPAGDAFSPGSAEDEVVRRHFPG